MRVLRFSASVLALSSLACAIGKEGEPDEAFCTSRSTLSGERR